MDGISVAGQAERKRRRRAGALALTVLAALSALAWWSGGRSASAREHDFERGCDALDRARLGERGAYAEARSAFLSARGRFYEERSAELALSVLDALEAATAEPVEPFLRALARRDDDDAMAHARRIGGSMADEGVRLASALARAAKRAADQERGRGRVPPSSQVSAMNHLSPRVPGTETARGASGAQEQHPDVRLLVGPSPLREGQRAVRRSSEVVVQGAQ